MLGLGQQISHERCLDSTGKIAALEKGKGVGCASVPVANKMAARNVYSPPQMVKQNTKFCKCTIFCNSRSVLQHHLYPVRSCMCQMTNKAFVFLRRLYKIPDCNSSNWILKLEQLGTAIRPRTCLGQVATNMICNQHRFADLHKADLAKQEARVGTAAIGMQGDRFLFTPVHSAQFLAPLANYRLLARILKPE